MRQTITSGNKSRTAMNDLIYIGITAAFFNIGALYVRFCEQL